MASLSWARLPYIASQRMGSITSGAKPEVTPPPWRSSATTRKKLSGSDASHQAGRRTHGTPSAAVSRTAVNTAAAASIGPLDDEVGGNSANTTALIATPAKGAG